MITSNRISPLRQRMIEDMTARNLGHRECQIFCVRAFCEGGFRFASVERKGISSMVSQYAWPNRAVKPQGRTATRRRRGA
jgi:hypothetical protein